MSKYEKIWPMLQGAKGSHKREIYKCTQCGGESKPRRGHNGAPSLHNCHPDCPCRTSDWKTGNSRQYVDNFDRIFPDAPGAGL